MEQTQPSQLEQYIPVLMLLVAAIGFAVGVLAISPLLGKYGRRTKAKDMAYECGKDPIGEGGARIKAIGARAREELASLLERKVHLFLNVKQRAGWDEERARLRAIGLEEK